jgi:ankyrin repeat protein
MRAAEQGHLEVVKYLVQAGADKEKEDKVSARCMLLLAAFVQLKDL